MRKRFILRMDKIAVAILACSCWQQCTAHREFRHAWVSCC